MLVSRRFGQHITKGYIYFAMAFALLVSCSTCRLRKGGTSPCTCMPESAEPAQRIDPGDQRPGMLI